MAWTEIARPKTEKSSAPFLIRLSDVPQEEPILFNPERVNVSFLDPNDPIVKSVVWPMIDHAFRRYTADKKGNDINGDKINLTGDRYDVSGKSKVTVAIQEGTVLGSVRFVQANYQPEIQPPIDAMILMKNHPWPSTNEIFFAELGRLVIHPQLSREEQGVVVKSLHKKSMEYAQNQSPDNKVYSILAHHVFRFLQWSGIEAVPCPEATLNWDHPEAVEIFNNFPRYWQPKKFYSSSQPPKLCLITPP